MLRICEIIKTSKQNITQPSQIPSKGIIQELNQPSKPSKTKKTSQKNDKTLSHSKSNLPTQPINPLSQKQQHRIQQQHQYSIQRKELKQHTIQSNNKISEQQQHEKIQR